MNRRSAYIIGIIILAILIVGTYIFFVPKKGAGTDTTTTTNSDSSGFTPFGRILPKNSATTTSSTPSDNTSASSGSRVIPAIRLLSSTPIGGYGASTTASTTVVRWVDRGRGNVYEARQDSLDILTLSNTLVPKIYASQWNTNLTAFIASTLQNDDTAVIALYAQLIARALPKQATSTASASSTLGFTIGSSQTPFDLKGANLPQGMIGYAVSPKKDKLFMMVNRNGRGIGYISTFDGKSVSQLFDTPITQANVEWPEDTTITITTRGSWVSQGYLYFVDTKTGVWKKVLGPVLGLSTKVSRDAKYVLASSAGDNGITTSIYNLTKGSVTDAVIRTLADKCVWGNFYKNLVYCGVPSKPAQGNLPDDWYTGTVSFADKIWQVNATTGEVHLISSLSEQANRVIDAINLGLDPKDNYLFFINKSDLSFWSLDLVLNH